MVVLCSIRQLIRTPVKTIFFFALLACTITFFILGFSLWSVTAQSIDEINRSFTTIGTAEQKPMSLKTGAMWNAYTKRYSYWQSPTYGTRIPLSVLDFKGTNYIQEPEIRPYYYVYDPGYVISDRGFLAEAAFNTNILIVEIQPESDCVPSQPVKVKVKKVLMGEMGDYMDEIWFCDSMNDNPEQMYANKTYIIGLQPDMGYSAVMGQDKQVYMPALSIQSLRFNKDTTTMTAAWDEVTENFFDTPRGKRWQALIDTIPKWIHFITAVPTNSTKLLMEFYTGDARITEGRDISSEEFKNGDKVCLIPSYFAQNNGLKVGDIMPLPLLLANYSLPPSFEGIGLVDSVINANDEAYSAFENSTYKIVGIYDTQPRQLGESYQLGKNTAVIPFASVKNSDENNIVTKGLMMGYSTSFQIPNGQIEQFMKAWQAQNITGLDIKFYDKGYTQIKAGLDSMMSISIILFAVGAATTIFVLFLFCHLFIAKQKKRTAIERSLGMSKRQCMLSLLTGMMIIVAIAFASAGAASFSLTDFAIRQVNAASTQNSYDTLFSDWVNSTDADKTASISVSTQSTGLGVLAGAAFIPVALLIAFMNIRGNLKEEPLRMLSERER